MNTGQGGRKLVAAATMGWSPQLILAPLTRRLQEADRVELHLLHLDPAGDKAAEANIARTLNEIKTMTLYLEKVETHSHRLPRLEPGMLAYRIAETLEPSLDDADTLHIIAAGGPRLLAAAATLLAAAASATTPKVKGFIVEEDTREEHPIPPIPIRRIMGETKAAIATILAQDPDKPKTYQEIAKATGKDPVTIKRLTLELAREGLAQCTKKTRTTLCRPTPTLLLIQAAEKIAQKL